MSTLRMLFLKAQLVIVRLRTFLVFLHHSRLRLVRHMRRLMTLAMLQMAIVRRLTMMQMVVFLVMHIQTVTAMMMVQAYGKELER